MPERIQRKRSRGWRLPEGAVVVSRPSKWGNPFKVGEEVRSDSPLWPYIAATVPGGAHGMTAVTPLDREQVVAAYQDWLVEQPHLMLSITAELAGRDLACWCPLPEPGQPDHCHASVLLATETTGALGTDGARTWAIHERGKEPSDEGHLWITEERVHIGGVEQPEETC